MKKVVFAVLALTLSGVCALAQGSVSATPANISLTATVEQTAQLFLSTPGVTFDVTNPSAVTVGVGTPIVNGAVNMKKGANATFYISSTDLTGGNGGGTIPAATVQYKADSGSFAPLSNTAAQFKQVTSANGGKQNILTTLSFQLLAVPSNIPDVYTGTATITLQVI